MEKWEIFFREVNNIKDENIKNFVKDAFDYAPAYFWTIAASRTGKYHPPDDVKVGGLVHHTKKVCYFAKELIVAMQCEQYADEIQAAALIHDLYKNGISEKIKTSMDEWSAHGLNLKKYIEQETYGGKTVEELFPDPAVQQKILKVLDLAARHMGKWGPETHPPVKREDWLLHIADYVSSRKLVVIEEGL